MSFLKSLFDPSERRATQENQRAKAFAQAGDLVHAIESFTKAIEATPGDGILCYNRGIAYLNKANAEAASVGYSKTNTHEVERALEDLRVSIRLKPDYPDTYGAIATAYMALGIQPLAFAFYRAIIDYGKPKTLVQLARERLANLQHVPAMEWEREWFTLCLTDHTTRSILRGARLKEEVRKPVMDLINAKYDDWAKEHYRIAHGFTRQNRWDLAVVHLLEGVRLSPVEFTEPIYLIASCYFMIGQYARCLRFLSLINWLDTIPLGLELKHRALSFREKYGDIRNP